jgi:sulfur carrier protein
MITMQLFINGQPKEFDQNTLNVTDLVTLMQLVGKRIAIECNGEIIPRSAFETTWLSSGDQLEIVGAVGGG